MRLEQIEEEAVRRVAKILGDTSAAAQCLAEAERRRAAGQTPIFYRGMGKHQRVIIVASVEDQDESNQDGVAK